MQSSAPSATHRIFVVGLVCAIALASAASSAITNASVDGNTVTADIVITGGAAGKLILIFEDATDLNLVNLDLTANEVNPADPDLLDRLPEGVTIPSEFPVLLGIGGGGTLSFRGRWSLELVTDNLSFLGGTPLRLFKAPDGGAFEDISVGLGSGSLRVFGIGSSFSGLVIADDARTVESVIEDKHMRLQTFLDAADGTIPAGLLATLQAKLQTARQSYVVVDLGTRSPTRSRS